MHSGLFLFVLMSTTATAIEPTLSKDGIGFLMSSDVFFIVKLDFDLYIMDDLYFSCTFNGYPLLVLLLYFKKTIIFCEVRQTNGWKLKVLEKYEKSFC